MQMSVNASNLIMGPATAYSASFGATEPLDSTINATPSAPWVDVGGTMGGIKLTVNQTYTELTVDQIVDTVGRRLTARDVQVATQFAEATLDNLAAALNGGTVTAGTTPVLKTYDPANAISATQPGYGALLFDGWGPSQFRRRVIVRKVLSMSSVDVEYTKSGQTVIPVTFGAHYVSASIPLFHIVDAQV
jgi:hypothetical protein